MTNESAAKQKQQEFTIDDLCGAVSLGYQLGKSRSDAFALSLVNDIVHGDLGASSRETLAKFASHRKLLAALFREEQEKAKAKE